MRTFSRRVVPLWRNKLAPLWKLAFDGVTWSIKQTRKSQRVGLDVLSAHLWPSRLHKRSLGAAILFQTSGSSGPSDTSVSSKVKKKKKEDVSNKTDATHKHKSSCCHYLVSSWPSQGTGEGNFGAAGVPSSRARLAAAWCCLVASAEAKPANVRQKLQHPRASVLLLTGVPLQAIMSLSSERHHLLGSKVSEMRRNISFDISNWPDDQSTTTHCTNDRKGNADVGRSSSKF